MGLKEKGEGRKGVRPSRFGRFMYNFVKLQVTGDEFKALLISEW
jgi:hypothetical protein